MTSCPSPATICVWGWPSGTSTDPCCARTDLESRFAFSCAVPSTDRIVSALERESKGDVIRQKSGLPPATYFSGGKIQWILENVLGVRADAEAGEALFGNTDSWVMWNLTGGVGGGVHVTDVTNASRTMLMNLETLDWDDGCSASSTSPGRCCPRSPRPRTRTGMGRSRHRRGSRGSR